jgi:CBS domain-containing protein
MKTVSQLLTCKENRSLYTIAPRDSVEDALSLMASCNIGALIVIEGGELVGIVSERDFVRKIRYEDTSRDFKVKDIMSAPVLTVSPRQTIRECMALFTERHLRHLPVLGDGQILGLLSIGDIVKAMIAEQDELIEQLEKYIRGD